ncbi:MAG TPA: hypothetical protein DDX33_04410 [Rikenellaceae bacterium]|nr:hypothetical protein [Rikenellaceae bacterium]
MRLKVNKIGLCKYDVCTQCYACKTACPKKCITMTEARDGFAVPEIDGDRCVECGTCMNACHRLNASVSFQKPLRTYACWTKNMNDRERSSSGGAFSVIAKKIISQGGVVYGASMCNDLQVRHIGIERESDIAMLQGSKYVQSYMGDTYAEVKRELQAGRLVLFTGTPCQVAGLLTFLHKPYCNLFTCDVVCHGVPSQKAFDAYIEKIGLKGRCVDFSFRFTKGWGFQLSGQLISQTSRRFQKIISPYKAYYLRAFTKGLMFSEACYSCAYARPERISDITLADYWGLGAMMPFKHPTHKGISCLLVNSSRVLPLLEDCSELAYEERPLEEAVAGNHNLSHSSTRPRGRDTYYEDSLTMSISALCSKYGIKATMRDYLRLLKQYINSVR